MTEGSPAFARDGAERFYGALDANQCADLEQALAEHDRGVAGVRIGAAPGLRALLAPDGSAGAIAASVLGAACRPVRAVLFDKNAETNWSLGWHQDRTIVVQQRHAVAGFGPWTIKSGLTQVEPPFDLLERMVTMRIHLDPVDQDNAPLRIVPGSHRLGRVAEADVAGTVASLGEQVCLAERGDIWLYATPILHGSRAADRPRRRRVLQVDFSADDLPEPLCWQGL